MFRAMVQDRSDAEILTAVKGNEEALLDGIFDAMAKAFDPSRAAGQSEDLAPGGEQQFQSGMIGR